MNIKDIKWPVYLVGKSSHIYEESGITWIDHYGKTSIIDNINLKGDSIGIRRLQIPKEDRYIFKKTLFIFPELIEETRKRLISDRYFVDSTGKLFKYLKKKMHQLICRKVINTKKYSTYVLVKVSGLDNNFEIPNTYWSNYSNLTEVYLILLLVNNIYVLYDIDTIEHKDTWRKV